MLSFWHSLFSFMHAMPVNLMTIYGNDRRAHDPCIRYVTCLIIFNFILHGVAVFHYPIL